MKPCLPWLFGALCILSLVACSGGASADFSSAPPAGTLDSNFGPDRNGRVIKDLGGTNDLASRVVIQPDGKIVVAASAGSETDQVFVLLRYHPNGTLDSSFGTGGRVDISFAASAAVEVPTGLALQADGRIVVSGYSQTSKTAADFVIARCLPDGTLDTSFGTNGKTITSFPSRPFNIAQGCAIQPNDGKIVVVGYSTSGTSTMFALARYKADGTPDSGFDTDGLLTTDVGNLLSPGSNDKSYASDVAIQGNKIIVSGDVADELFVAARYNIGDGSLDTTFGQSYSGIAEGPLGVTQNAHALAVQSDGSVLLGGFMLSSSQYSFRLVRFKSNGEVDLTFNGPGQVATDFGPGAAAVQDLLLTADSKILAVGYAQDSGGYLDFTLARYNPNGILDTTFGTNGVLMVAMGPTDSSAFGAALQADRKIVVAGKVEVSTKVDDIGLLRVWP